MHNLCKEIIVHSKMFFFTSELLVQLFTAIYLIKIRELDNAINSCHRFGELINCIYH